jgi:hypothetical protein
MGVKMNAGRRTFLGRLVVALGAQQMLWAAQGTPQAPFPQSKQPESFPKSSDHSLLKLNQKDLKRDVQRLVELAQALQKEVEKTDSTEVLSLSVVRKAEEIEKLAKRIKSLARG